MTQLTGKTSVKFRGIEYPLDLTFNLATIQTFEEMTGDDFHAVAFKAINAWRKCSAEKIINPFDIAEVMTQAVTLKHAAVWFYAAAKVNNSKITFDEMQENVLLERAYQHVDEEGKTALSYPIMFVDSVTSVLMGKTKNDGKKKPS
jgi:hypothetical protein